MFAMLRAENKCIYNNNNIIFITILLYCLNWNGSSGDVNFRRSDLTLSRDLTIDRDEDLVNLSTDGEDTCPPQFQKRCECTYIRTQELTNRVPTSSRDKFVVNCTNSGFTNTSMLQFLPLQTEELIFTDNKIHELHRNIFGTSGYPKLKVVDLSNNHIQVIDGQAFHHVSSVETLNLNHNDLSSKGIKDHPRMFSSFHNLKTLHLTNTFNENVWSLDDLAEIFQKSNLTQLTKLHMEQNELELIANLTMFCSLPSLTQLYLGQNKLHDLSLDTECFKNLEFIDLRDNLITTISKESGLWEMTNLKNQIGDQIRVDLLGNPINCDCYLEDFIHWLRKQSLKNIDYVRDNERLLCETGLPLTNKGLFVKEIEVTECPPQLEIANYNGVTTVVIWFLIIVLIVVLVTMAYWNRSYFRRQVRPLLEPSTHGVKYTSIEKNEEAEIAHV